MRAHQLISIAIFGFLACIFLESTLAYTTRPLLAKIGNCNCSNLLKKDSVHKNGVWNKTITEDKNYSFGNQKISCIKIAHKDSNGNLADFYLVSNGTNVSLKFRSQIGYGIHKDIELLACDGEYHPHSGASVTQDFTSFLLLSYVAVLYLYQQFKL